MLFSALRVNTAVHHFSNNSFIYITTKQTKILINFMTTCFKMVLPEGTIHDVLTQRNPTLDVKTKKGGNTKRNDWAVVEYDCLKPVCMPHSERD